MRKRHLILAGVAVGVVLLLALAVVSCGGGTTTTSAPATTASTAPVTTASPPTTAGSGTTIAVDAAALYSTNCSGCHQQVPTADAASAKTVIEAGRQSMPGFKDKLTAAQIDALAAYVASGGK